MHHFVRVLFAALVLAGAPTRSDALSTPTPCAPSGTAATVEELARRVEGRGIRYVFVGERHGVGPVKRFVVDLTNRLVERGHQVGLYVEGFRTDCAPGVAGCEDLARLFNPEAFSALVRESRAPVRALDPPENDERARRMARTIARGSETIRLVLVGSSHVRGAWDPEAVAPHYGGAMSYPDPGDLVEAFPPDESLTVVLEAGDEEAAPYRLLSDGCSADYRLVAPYLSAY